MKTASILSTSPQIAASLLALTALSWALPAGAVEIAFFGGSNINNLTTVVGTDGIGDAWQTHNGPALVNSNFAMSDFNATAQIFNPVNFTNGLGNYATSLQLTVNQGQLGAGFKGVNTGTVASGLINNFTVQPNLADPSTWITWTITYDLADATTGLFQQVLFTAPTGTKLGQGTNFSANVNFAGIMTNDSGWSASWGDRGAVSTVPVPASLALVLIGGLGLSGIARRR